MPSVKISIGRAALVLACLASGAHCSSPSSHSSQDGAADIPGVAGRDAADGGGPSGGDTAGRGGGAGATNTGGVVGRGGDVESGAGFGGNDGGGATSKGGGGARATGGNAGSVSAGGRGGGAAGGAASGGGGKGGVAGAGGRPVVGTGGQGGACATACSADAYCSAGTCRSRLTQWGAGVAPTAITRGADGNVWYTGGTKIGKMNVNGAATLYDAVDWTITEPGESLWMSGFGITLGPDGNVWYLMVSQAGRGFLNVMTPAGKVKSSVFSTTTPMLGTIAAGPDGNIWFAEKYANVVTETNKVYVTTTGGVVTTVPLPAPMSIERLIAGPDGNLWFTRWGGGEAGQPLERLTVAGVLTPFPVQAPVNPYRVAVGPDGNLWFTEFYRAAVGRMTLAGVVDEFPLVSSTAYGIDLVAGPDGNVWVTQITPSALVRVTPAGAATEIPLTARPEGITVGADNALWFILGSSIGRYVPP